MNADHPHLTEDQLDDLLLGEASTAATEHAAACAQCHGKLQAFTALMADFNQSSLAWSQARSTQHPHIHASHTPAPRRLFTAPAYAFAATILVLVTIVFGRFSLASGTPGHAGHEHPATAVQPTT